MKPSAYNGQTPSVCDYEKTDKPNFAVALMPSDSLMKSSRRSYITVMQGSVVLFLHATHV